MAPVPAPLPLVVLGGFLGSGKTTVLNRILAGAGDRTVMVLVNDFGTIAVDAELIRARSATMLTLANGCVCCAVGGDLFAAFDRALEMRPRPDHLVIETSGVADPGRIADFARAEPEFKLDQVVTLLDALNIEQGLADPLLRATLERQVAAADMVMVTKTDLAPVPGHAALEAIVRRYNRSAPVVVRPGDGALVPLLLGPAHAGDAGSAGLSAGAGTPAHDHLFRSFTVRSDRVPDAAELRATLDRLPAGVLRLKGVAVPGTGAPALAFHIAGRHKTVDPLPSDDDRRPGLRAVAIALRRDDGEGLRAALGSAFAADAVPAELEVTE